MVTATSSHRLPGSRGSALVGVAAVSEVTYLEQGLHSICTTVAPPARTPWIRELGVTSRVVMASRLGPGPVEAMVAERCWTMSRSLRKQTSRCGEGDTSLFPPVNSAFSFGVLPAVRPIPSHQHYSWRS